MARRKKPVGPVCVWSYDSDGTFYETACGHAYQFTDGGPTENGQRYCGYCGRLLKLASGER